MMKTHNTLFKKTNNFLEHPTQGQRKPVIQMGHIQVKNNTFCGITTMTDQLLYGKQ